MDFGTIWNRLLNFNFVVPVLILALAEDALASRDVGGIGTMIGRRSSS